MHDAAADHVPPRVPATAALARGGAIWLVASLIGGAALVVLDAWSGRVLGPDAYGAYGTLRRVAQFAGFVVLLGMENVVVRHVAIAGEPDAARRVVRVASLSVGFVGTVLGVGVALGAGAIAALLQLGPDGPEAVRWVALSLPLGALRMVAVAASQGHGHARVRPFVMNLLWPASQALAILAVARAWMPGTPLVAMTRGWVAAMAGGCVWAFVALYRMRASVPGAGASASARPTDVPAMAAMAWPLWLHGIVIAAYAWADHVALAAVHGPAEAAVYGPVVALAPMYGLALVALNGPLAPMLAAHHAAGDHDALHVLFRAAARWASLLSALPVLVTLVAPDALLRGWPDLATPQAQAALQVAAVAQWIGVACGSVNYLLAMTGHARAVWFGVAPALAASFVGSWLLIPPLGALGASLANGGALVAANLVGAWVVWRRLRISAFDGAFVRACGAMAVPALVGVGAARVPVTGWARLVLVCMAVGLAWLPAAWFGGLDTEERTAIRRRLGRAS